MRLGRAPLQSVWAKIARAEEHRKALHTYITEAFAIEANLPRIGAKFDGEAREYVLYVNHMPDLTKVRERVAVILGDSVHNLRSALDHLVFQLALAHTNGNVRSEERVQFPICDTPERFAKARQSNLAEVSPYDAATIERLQPYHGGNAKRSLLARLRDLSNTDKHRALPTVLLPPEAVKGVGFGMDVMLSEDPDRLVESLSGFAAKPLELNAEIMRTELVYAPHEEQVDMAGHVVPQIVFPEGGTVHLVIEQIVAKVIQVVRKFE